MRLSAACFLLVAGVALSGVAASCSDAAEDDGNSKEAFCEPGLLSYCKCRGDRAGTRECNEKGSAFLECVADDGGACEEILEGEGGAGSEGGLYLPCTIDEDCEGEAVCAMGFCTHSCDHFTQCAPPLGDCVAFQGASLCLPRCQSQIECNQSFGPLSKCSYTADLIPPAGVGFTGCADWPGDPVLPPDGYHCKTEAALDDEKCHLGLEAVERICVGAGICGPGCHQASDCPAGTSCDAGASICAVGCACGDGVCDTSCEDQTSCAADCAGASVEGDKCPGVLVPVSSAGGTVVVNGDTSLAPPPSEAKGTAGCAPSSTATEELIYQVQPNESGTLLILLEPGPGFDSQLYVRSGSCTTGEQIGCDDAIGNGVSEIVEVEVTAGNKVSVFVDGYSGSTGPFTLQILLSATIPD